jgi:tetratricopeptide (TPR) repeat protein
VSEQAFERSSESSQPVSLPPSAPPAPLPQPTAAVPRPSQTAQSRRRAELAMAAAQGATGQDLVLRSDAEGLALLGVDEESPMLADVLRWQGNVLRDRGNTVAAESLYKRSLDVAQKLDYLAGQSHAVNCLGAVAQRRGELHRASQLFQAAQRMAEGCGDTQLAGMIQQNRGVIADMAGNSGAAFTHYTQSLKSFEATNDTRAMTLVLNNLGMLHVKTGRYAEARACYDRALILARSRTDMLSEGVIEENVAELEMKREDFAAASESIARALEIAALRQDPLRRASGLKLLGVSLRLSGRAKDAIEPLRTAFALSEGAEDALLCGEILYECGLALCDVGDKPRARESWLRSLSTFERIGAAAWVERVHSALDAM